MLTALLLSTLSCWLQQGSLVIASGPQPDQLQVQVVDEANPLAPPALLLSNVELLPIAMTARTTFDAWRHDRPRLVEDQGIARVQLPDGGALHKYRRAGKTIFGWLLVTPTGRPLVLLERTGTGAGNLGDPFLPEVGIARDGRFAGMAAGNDVLLVRLDGTAFPSTATPARLVLRTPAGAVDTSFVLGPAAFFFQTGEPKVLRCATSDNAVPEELVLPPATRRLDGEMAISDDGSTLAFLAGQDRNSLVVYTAGLTGQAFAVSPPGHYEAPGYLPGFATGPLLLLSADGARVAYTESSNREEVFTVPSRVATPPIHVTADPLFNPYVDTGVFFVFMGQVLTIGIGTGVNAVDFYSAQEVNGAVTIQNLTLTSGIAAPPFGGTATIDPAAVRRLGGNALLIENRTASGIELLQVDVLTGVRTVLATGLAGTPDLRPSGPGVLPDLIAGGNGISALFTPTAGGYQTALALPATLPLRTSIQQPRSGWRLFSAEVLPGLEVTLLGLLPSTVLLFDAAPPASTVAWTPAGGALFARPAAGTTDVDWFSAAGTQLRLPVSAPEVRLLNASAR